MPDREKVIKALEYCITGDCGSCFYRQQCIETGIKRDALDLLKEQEEREKKICKGICDIIRGTCSTDTDDDKDFVCYEIQKRFTEGR